MESGSDISRVFISDRHNKPVKNIMIKKEWITQEELDFIINYDIKYRMGRDGGNEEAE